MINHIKYIIRFEISSLIYTLMRKIEDVILRNTERPHRMALFLVLPPVVGLIALLVTFYYWDQRSHHNFIDLQMKETAKAHMNQILLTRLWNASHGGVYVEITEDTPPNPYLDDPEKVIVSTSGKRYTKLNPAYMTRQISELSGGDNRFLIHMSSLRPKNPANTPDEWEKGMLHSFDDGKEEGYGFVTKQGNKYFRYMIPMVVSEECLTCHGGEGYKVGDIKGGISMSIPAGYLSAIHAELDSRSLIAFGAIGVFTISILVVVTWVSAKKLGQSLRKELENERLVAAMKMASAAAHELRQPMTSISGFSELLKERLEEGEDITVEADIIIRQCGRMNDIISSMLNVTTYRTKNYGEEAEIFDLGVKTEEPEISSASRPKC